MLTILELITSVLNYVLGIAFISNFYPFRNKLQVRIPICAAILIARSVLNVNVVYHLYYLKAILYVILFILCTVILLKCDKFRFLLLDALCIAILYLAEIIGGLIIIIPRHISMFEMAESDELRTPLFFTCMFIVVVLYSILGVIVKYKKNRKSYDNQYITPYEVILFAVLVRAEYLQKSPLLLKLVSAYLRLIASSSMSFTRNVIRCLRTSLGSVLSAVSCGGDSPSVVSGGSVKSTSPVSVTSNIGTGSAAVSSAVSVSGLSDSISACISSA